MSFWENGFNGEQLEVRVECIYFHFLGVGLGCPGPAAIATIGLHQILLPQLALLGDRNTLVGLRGRCQPDLALLRRVLLCTNSD